MTPPAAIFRELLDETRRGPHTAKLFGIRFPMYLESFIFDTAGALAERYDGGYWNFYALSNGAFYMAPDSGDQFQVRCANGFEGELSADAFGITVCMYAYSQLSFTTNADFAEKCAQHFHWLHEYSVEHEERSSILRAID